MKDGIILSAGNEMDIKSTLNQINFVDWLNWFKVIGTNLIKIGFNYTDLWLTNLLSPWRTSSINFIIFTYVYYFQILIKNWFVVLL